MTGKLGSIDCHAELLLREKNLEGRKFRHALVHRNAGKKLNALEINMILNWVFENMYTFEWAKWIFSKTTFFKSAQRIEKNGITRTKSFHDRSNFNLFFLFDLSLTTTSRILIGISTFFIYFSFHSTGNICIVKSGFTTYYVSPPHHPRPSLISSSKVESTLRPFGPNASTISQWLRNT
jgi:hypothetical protein